MIARVIAHDDDAEGGAGPVIVAAAPVGDVMPSQFPGDRVGVLQVAADDPGIGEPPGSSPGASPYPASMSAVTGTSTLRVIRAIAANISADGVRWPSA
jgi:hypothetical protein